MMQSTKLVQQLLVRARFYDVLHRRGLLYSSKKGVRRDWLAWIQQPINFSPSAIRQWLKRQDHMMLVQDHKLYSICHRFVPERHQSLGADLSAAHFVVGRANGAVKLQHFDEWICKDVNGKYRLPSMSSVDVQLEAVDLSRTQVMYTSFENFANLQHLKYLNISYCPSIDDWCLDKLVMLRDSLLVLDISGCRQISEGGIASLHRLHRLTKLVMSDMPHIRHRRLIAAMLEHVLPSCVVVGIGEENEDCIDFDVGKSLPEFVQNYFKRATLIDKEVKTNIMSGDVQDSIDFNRSTVTSSRKSQMPPLEQK